MEDVCLFAHFDPEDKVDDYVLRYLRELRKLNFSVVFISTARLDKTNVERLRVDCCDVILRENAGLDFGSWSAGFAKHGASIDGRLLLANDSVYGPVGSLSAALDRLAAKPADFYGMVESLQAAPHLQSWFLLFEPWVVRHEAFKQVLAQPFSLMNKKQIVVNGEVALSRRLMTAGFRYEALCKDDSFGPTPARHAANPMLLFWREVLERGVPFLKIELLRANPLGVEDASTILATVERSDPALASFMSSHLARLKSSVPRSGPRPFPVRLQYALVRRRFRLKRENKRAATLWNAIALEAVTAPLTLWRRSAALFGRTLPDS
jgi:lipopolysaccharide biosynthesis protein